MTIHHKTLVWVVIFLGFFISTEVFAETAIEDIVTFSDGEVIQGQIVELNTIRILIKREDLSTFERPFKEIYSIKKKEAQSGAEGADDLYGPAGQGPIRKETAAPALLPRHSWDLGTFFSNITYEEPGLMKNEGSMYGLRGTYTYHKEQMFRADMRIGRGKVDYTSKNTGSMKDIDDTLFEVRGLVGADVMKSKTSALTLYTGFGYRYLKNDSSDRRTSTGHYGYERESNYYYSPIGLEILGKGSKKWRIKTIIEYDYFWFGKQVSHLSDADPQYGDIESHQDYGYGYRASFELTRKFENSSLSVEPYYRYWDIDKSELNNLTYSGVIIGTGWEPENNTTEYGVILSYDF